MKKTALIFLFLAVCTLTSHAADMVATAAIGNRIYVSPNGNDGFNGTINYPVKTIKQASSMAMPGDTVLIKGGVYSEHTIRPRSGTSTAKIVFKPLNPADTVFMHHPAADSTDATSIFRFDGISHVRIDGLCFKNFQFGNAICINHSSSNIEVVNCRFQNIGDETIHAWPNMSCVCINGSDNCYIVNNYFENIWGDGIGCGGESHYNFMAYNTFVNFHGQHRGWAPTGHFSSGITEGTTSYGHNVMAFNYGYDIVNLIWFDRDGSTNVILRNVAHDSSLLFFNESRCARNIAQENVGWNLKAVGLQSALYDTGWTSDTRWVHNVVFNSNAGYRFSKSWRNEVRGNIIEDCGSACLNFDEIADTCGPHVFAYNLWYSKKTSKPVTWINKKVTYQEFTQLSGETNGMSREAEFNYPEGGDFTLAEDSPCRGAGYREVDLGAYPVYPEIPVGRQDELVAGTDLVVQFDSIISRTSRGEVLDIGVSLSKKPIRPVTLRVVPVAGETREGTDFTLKNADITFAVGEQRKQVEVSLIGQSDYNELLALAIEDVNGASLGSARLYVLDIKPAEKTPGTWIEAEEMKNTDTGGAWTEKEDADCSEGKYLEVTAKNNNPFKADNAYYQLKSTFEVSEAGDYHFYARVKAASLTNPSGDDGYGAGLDNTKARSYNGFTSVNDYTPGEWIWIDLFRGEKTLTAGQHTLTIVGLEDGFCIDRIFITQSDKLPKGTGDVSTGIDEVNISDDLAPSHRQIAIYNLQGQQINGVPTRPGIYIINGRKVIFK